MTVHEETFEKLFRMEGFFMDRIWVISHTYA